MTQQPQAMDILAMMTGQSAPSLPVTTDEDITSREAIAALVLANGDLALAAERLYGNSQQAPRLVALIASDMSAPAVLAAQMRALATVNMFATLNKVQRELDDKISLMEPYDLSKTYTAILDKVLQATDNHESTQNVNLTEVVLSILPAEAREALKQLVQQPATSDLAHAALLPTTSTVIDHSNDNDAGSRNDMGSSLVQGEV